MKRSKQRVPKTETGAIPGDGGGSTGMQLPKGATRQPNLGTSGSGIAPRPSGGAAIPGNDRPSHPAQAGLARVKSRPSSPTGQGGSAGSFMPERNNAFANIAHRRIGQPNPNTGAAASAKPKRKGLGAAFWGEY